MGASNNDSDDDIEIIDEVGGAGEKGSSGSQKELSDKMDMKFAAILRYKVSLLFVSGFVVPDRIYNSVADYRSSRVDVVCPLFFHDGITFECFKSQG